nr:hypothetical protein [Butyricimonas synergistica]
MTKPPINACPPCPPREKSNIHSSPSNSTAEGTNQSSRLRPLATCFLMYNL